MHRSPIRNAGTTLAELIIAVAILSAGLSGVFATYSMGLQKARAGRQTSIASECLSARTEQFRGTTWAQITDSAYLASSVLSTAATADGILPQLAQQVTVSDYPVASPPKTSIVVARSAAGAVTVTSSNAALANSSMLSVTVRQTWLGAKGVSRAFETCFITAKNGVKR